MTPLLAALAVVLAGGPAMEQAAPLAAGETVWPSERAAPETIKETARQVLASREFATDLRSAALRQLYERLLQALRERLEGLVGFLSASSKVAAVIAIVVAALCVALAAYIIWLAVRGLPHGRAGAVGSGSEPGDAGEVEVIDLALPSSSELRHRARALQASGDTSGAVRYYFLAYLARLHELGLVLLDPRRTNAEYLRALGGHVEHGPLLREAVDRFERVWYGGQPGRTRDVEALEALSRPAAEGVRG